MSSTEKLFGEVIQAYRTFSFIRPTDPTRDDIFCHQSALADNRKRLVVGETVSFVEGEYNGRRVAQDVHVIVAVNPLAKLLANAPKSSNAEGSDAR